MKLFLNTPKDVILFIDNLEKGKDTLTAQLWEGILEHNRELIISAMEHHYFGLPTDEETVDRTIFLVNNGDESQLTENDRYHGLNEDLLYNLKLFLGYLESKKADKQSA